MMVMLLMQAGAYGVGETLRGLELACAAALLFVVGAATVALLTALWGRDRAGSGRGRPR